MTFKFVTSLGLILIQTISKLKIAPQNLPLNFLIDYSFTLTIMAIASNVWSTHGLSQEQFLLELMKESEPKHSSKCAI